MSTAHGPRTSVLPGPAALGASLLLLLGACLSEDSPPPDPPPGTPDPGAPSPRDAGDSGDLGTPRPDVGPADASADASAADPDATDGSPDAPSPTDADTGSPCGLQPFADCVWMPGVCAPATPRCDPPAGWVCVPDPPAPHEPDGETLCDGLDNDCDGLTDEPEHMDPPEARHQHGVCHGARQVCVAEAGWSDPDYEEVPAYEAGAETLCDGLDNDCDGKLDEHDGMSPPAASLQAGVCAGARQVCAGVDSWVEPDYTALEGYAAEDLPCDGLDNDCDGETDEGPAPGRYVCVPAGELAMGSPADEPGRLCADPDRCERQHRVAITRPFQIKTTEVTQAEWREVMDDDPSQMANCGDDCPVGRITWLMAILYCNAVSPPGERCYLDPQDGSDFSAEDALSGELPVWDGGPRCPGYRLPTEAEWEYAARAGAVGAIPSDEPLVILGERNAPALDPIAWYGGNSGVDYEPAEDCSGWVEVQLPAERCGKHPVALKAQNAFGLYDMLGNAREWVWDTYARDYGGIDDPDVPVRDPEGAPRGRERVQKGCGWSSVARACRPACRSGFDLGQAASSFGFRPVRTLPP